MAILVVDINQGFQPQTIEALQILRNCKTPFVIAATKIDRIHGWRIFENESFLSSFAKQNDRVKGDMENKTYEMVGNFQNWNSPQIGSTGYLISSATLPLCRSVPTREKDLLICSWS